jgi:hypothetical protein
VGVGELTDVEHHFVAGSPDAGRHSKVSGSRVDLKGDDGGQGIRDVDAHHHKFGLTALNDGCIIKSPKYPLVGVPPTSIFNPPHKRNEHPTAPKAKGAHHIPVSSSQKMNPNTSSPPPGSWILASGS